MPTNWELEREVEELQGRMRAAQMWIADMQKEMRTRPERIVKVHVVVDRPVPVIVERVTTLDLAEKERRAIHHERISHAKRTNKLLAEIARLREIKEVEIDDIPLRRRDDGLPFLLAPRTRKQREDIRRILA